MDGYRQWLQRHSPTELERLQREDPDIGPVMCWIDAGKVPGREAVSPLSPFSGKLWLNWDNLLVQSKILYQKILPDDNESPSY